VKTITVKVEESLHTQLTALAKRRKTTRSILIREALRTCLEGNAELKASSSLALAQDLAGCVKGPRDLSTNPAHMKNFGR